MAHTQTDVFQPPAPPPPKPPPKLSPLQKLQMIRYDVPLFLNTCVLTLDPTDKRSPIKPFPKDLPYIPPLCDRLLIERLIAVRKSRRMLFTWFMSGYNLHDAMFNVGRSIFVVSDKEEKSDEIVRRSKFIYDNIPEDVLPIKPKAVYKYCRLSFPEIDSFIQGVPQGRDQLRQFTASRIFGDEFAFWEEAEATYGSMRPTIQGGGQIVLGSTSFPGFFKKLIEDEVA